MFLVNSLEWPPFEIPFLVWHKIFGPAQTILGPVEGQGIFIYEDCPCFIKEFCNRGRGLSAPI